MTETEKVHGSDSIQSMSDFNPIGNSTRIDDEYPLSPEPQTPAPSQNPKVEEDFESPPSSVCFFDQTEEPTRPIGPMQNSDKIVSETQDVLNNVYKMMLEQRRFLLVCAYQISSLQLIVRDHYIPLLSKIETFLTHCDRFQTEWFLEHYRLLPPYTDYSLVLKDNPAKVMVNEIPNPVEESTLKYLAEDVINNLFAGALQIKFVRSLNTEVSLRMKNRIEAFQEEDLPVKLWMKLFEVQSENAKQVEVTCFELFSSIDLLSVDVNLNPKQST